jgi:hypothetical protein
MKRATARSADRRMVEIPLRILAPQVAERWAETDAGSCGKVAGESV